MLDHRLRRWLKTGPSVGERIVFDGWWRVLSSALLAHSQPENWPEKGQKLVPHP